MSSTKLAIWVDKKYTIETNKIRENTRDNAMERTLDNPVFSIALAKGNNIAANKMAKANGTRMFCDTWIKKQIKNIIKNLKASFT